MEPLKGTLILSINRMPFGPPKGFFKGSFPGPGRAPQTLAWNGFYGFFQEPLQKKGCEHIQKP